MTEFEMACFKKKKTESVVILSAGIEFSGAILAALEHYRDEVHSDITLKVGDVSLYAHRCILTIHSGYFKTLFESKFADAKAREIDLSSVVEDADTLEKIIKFMYFGMISVTDEDSILEIARLSSYFDLDILHYLCEEKILRMVTLDNCLQYYQFSKTHNYCVLAKLIETMFLSRFHDYFVFKEDALELGPEVVNYLLEKYLFSSCGKHTVLEFAAKWVKQGCSNQHLKIGIKILEYLAEQDNTEVPYKYEMQELVDCLEKVQSKLTNEKLDSSLSSKFKEIFTNILSDLSQSNLPSLENDELVVIALSKRKINGMPFLLTSETQEKDANNGLNKHEQVYDLSMYSWKTKCWYHITKLEYQNREQRPVRNYMDILMARPRPLWEDSAFFKFLGSDAIPECLLSGTKVLLTTPKSHEVLKCDLLTREWSSVACSFKQEVPETGEETLEQLWNDTDDEYRSRTIGYHFAAAGNNVFLVKTKTIEETTYTRKLRQISGCYFEISRVDISTGNLTKIADSPVQHFKYKKEHFNSKRCEGIRSSAKIKISESNGEALVIVYLDDEFKDRYDAFAKYFIFVVNVKENRVRFCAEERLQRYAINNIVITEEEDCFLVFHNKGAGDIDLVFIYKFSSRKLEPVKDTSFRFYVDGMGKGIENQPRQLSAYSGDFCMWYFQSYMYYGSGIEMYTFYGENYDEERSSSDCTPPPFSSLICLCESKVKEEVLKTMKPIERYLIK